MQFLTRLFVSATVACACCAALAQTDSPLAATPDNKDVRAEQYKAAIQKNMTQRVPQLGTIEEIRTTALPGVFEIRVNSSEIYYTDAQANYLFQGNLIDTRQRRNLTEERVTKLTAIKFESLPLKDAFTIVRGNGQRKLVVFEDPNCGYCKRFERDLQNVNNVTIYMFLYPILGQDSTDKSKAIWCSKDRALAWQDWMVREQPAPAAAAMCDTAALTRNVEFGRIHKITGTPTLLFTNGARVPGAVDAQQVEKLLTESKG